VNGNRESSLKAAIELSCACKQAANTTKQEPRAELQRHRKRTVSG